MFIQIYLFRYENFVKVLMNKELIFLEVFSILFTTNFVSYNYLFKKNRII